LLWHIFTKNEILPAAQARKAFLSFLVKTLFRKIGGTLDNNFASASRDCCDSGGVQRYLVSIRSGKHPTKRRNRLGQGGHGKGQKADIVH
jgi:hypothetical protein